MKIYHMHISIEINIKNYKHEQVHSYITTLRRHMLFYGWIIAKFKRIRKNNNKHFYKQLLYQKNDYALLRSNKKNGTDIGNKEK